MTRPDDEARDTDVPDGSEVDARLRVLARMSASAPDAAPLCDMSSDAITARLLDCAEISALALALAGAAKAG